jgi:hypothetical protein
MRECAKFHDTPPSVFNRLIDCVYRVSHTGSGGNVHANIRPSELRTIYEMCGIRRSAEVVRGEWTRSIGRFTAALLQNDVRAVQHHALDLFGWCWWMRGGSQAMLECLRRLDTILTGPTCWEQVKDLPPQIRLVTPKVRDLEPYGFTRPAWLPPYATLGHEGMTYRWFWRE